MGAMRAVILAMGALFVMLFGAMTLTALGSAELNFASIIAFGFSFLILAIVVLGLANAIMHDSDDDE
jgi:predicted transporter